MNLTRKTRQEFRLSKNDLHELPNAMAMFSKGAGDDRSYQVADEPKSLFDLCLIINKVRGGMRC